MTTQKKEKLNVKEVALQMRGRTILNSITNFVPKESFSNPFLAIGSRDYQEQNSGRKLPSCKSEGDQPTEEKGLSQP